MRARARFEVAERIAGDARARRTSFRFLSARVRSLARSSPPPPTPSPLARLYASPPPHGRSCRDRATRARMRTRASQRSVVQSDSLERALVNVCLLACLRARARRSLVRSLVRHLHTLTQRPAAPSPPLYSRVSSRVARRACFPLFGARGARWLTPTQHRHRHCRHCRCCCCCRRRHRRYSDRRSARQRSRSSSSQSSATSQSRSNVDDVGRAMGARGLCKSGEWHNRAIASAACSQQI